MSPAGTLTTVTPGGASIIGTNASTCWSSSPRPEPPPHAARVSAAIQDSLFIEKSFLRGPVEAQRERDAWGIRVHGERALLEARSLIQEVRGRQLEPQVVAETAHRNQVD